MLRPQIVVNLKLERGKGIDRMRPSNRGQRCSCAKHDSLDNRIVKIVQINFMGHNRGRDNMRKRAARRRKTERLATKKPKQKTAK